MAISVILMEHNSSQIPEPGWYQGFGQSSFDADGADGYKFTWEAAGSADGTTIKANEQTKYPAFYNAGHYVPTLPAGKVLTGSIVGKKWFLPSAGEIARLYVGVRTVGMISYEPQSMGGGMYSTTSYVNHPYQYSAAEAFGMLRMAFQQVGGDMPYEILTSSTINNTYFKMSPRSLEINYVGDVRPFIHY